MDIESFVQEFAKQFDDIPAESFTPDTLFKENDEWSSMTALSIIAMVDEIYAVRLTGDDIKRSSTVTDVYNIVAEKANP